jgi:hypothetical protein
MAFDLIAELEALVDTFEHRGIGYAICGGLALALHGHPRATMGIDILLPRDQLTVATEAARALGFDGPARMMTFGLRTNTPREVQRISKLDATSGELLSLDLLVVAPTLEQVWLDRATVVVGERRMVVVSRAGLATMKRIAGRPQDLADLAMLEGTGDDET